MLGSSLNICKSFDYDTFIKGLFVYNRAIPDFLHSVDNGGSIWTQDIILNQFFLDSAIIEAP